MSSHFIIENKTMNFMICFFFQKGFDFGKTPRQTTEFGEAPCGISFGATYKQASFGTELFGGPSIDFLYIYAVYTSFQPTAMTSQCVCPSLGFRILLQIIF